MSERDAILDKHPELECFHDGAAELSTDAGVAGYVATHVMHFRGFPALWRQPWVWLVVVWSDGTKERSVEDYAPWSYVSELREGHFEWLGGRAPAREGLYRARWLDPEEALAVRARLGIEPSDF